MPKKNLTLMVNESTALHLWLMFGLMTLDVGKERRNLAISNTTKSNAFERVTSLFQSLISFHSIQSMIHPLLALLSLMMRVVMMILLLNIHIQNQRDISLNMLLQRRRPHHFHQRHLILLHREQQCLIILIHREIIHLQREITVENLFVIGIRIIV